MPVLGFGCKRVGYPSGSVIDKDIDRSKFSFSSIEKASRRPRIGQIGFDGSRHPSLLPDMGDDVFGIGGSIPSICITLAGIILF